MREPVFLITGATGLLGPYLVERAAERGIVRRMARANSDFDCDLADIAAVRCAVAEIRPDVVIHAAALTDVDACEHDPKAAEATNHLATAQLAESLPSTTELVVFSTIAVYPDSTGPHVEGTEGPVNVYGRTKLAGERAAMTHARTLVLRTSMFGPSRDPRRKSLSDFIVANLSAGKRVSLFEDELFSPLHLATLADVTLQAIDAGIHGIYNAASRDGMSKSSFGLAVARHLGLPEELVDVTVSRSMPGRTLRALDMRLDPERLERALGSGFPSLVEEIEKL